MCCGRRRGFAPRDQVACRVLPVAFPRPRVKLSDSVVSDTKHSPPTTTPKGPGDADEATGPASTGAQWPLPEEAFWSEKTDPHGTAPPGAGHEKPEPEPEPSPEPEAPRRKRDPYLDNVKFVLIAFVIVGHSLVPTLNTDSARSLYIFIYTFHMPLFVLVSGYLSRNFWNSNAKTNKLVDTFVVPYVIVEVGYALVRLGLGRSGASRSSTPRGSTGTCWRCCSGDCPRPCGSG